MARALALLCLALLLGCRTPGRGAGGARGVKVVEVGTTFAEPGHGELQLLLEVQNPERAAGEVAAVDWELWLAGRWFAAGAQALSAQLPSAGAARVSLALPLEFRGLAVSSQPVSLEVGVRGSLSVVVSGEEQRLSFEEVRRIRSQGAPLFSTGATEE